METPVSSIVTQGDLGGQKVQMTFDQNSLAHLMSVLTDLYSDPQLAVIREYSTNALDAHRECGNTDPIQVFTPSGLSPYFVVKDFGVGLSVDDITNMYSKYGASSKRGTNEQVGMLGLGAKSALTLVPQFTLISVKNGVKIHVSISRNSDGAGQMEIIDTAATDEMNGVEIRIPIPRNVYFVEKCRDFFRFWEPGTVLLDGKEPVRVEGKKVGTRFIMNKNLGRDYIVMGNVAYPCEDNLYRNSYFSLGVVAFVNIGDVNFTPSREALQYTAQTKKTINQLQNEFAAALTASVNEDIAKSDSFVEAWKSTREWRNIFYGRFPGITYKGFDVPDSIEINDAKTFDLLGKGTRYSQWLRSVTPDNAKSHIFITGFADSLKMSPVQREKVVKYAESIGKSFSKVAISSATEFHKDAAVLPWLTEFTFVDWSVIAPIKIERNVAGNKVMRTDPYDLYTGSYGTTQIGTLDPSKQIVYFSPADLQRPKWIFNYLDADAQVIVLAKNRWEKFKRDWPTAVEYTEAIKAFNENLVKQLTDADKIVWHYSSYRYSVRNLDYTKINDPDLHLFVETLRKDNKFSAPAQKLYDSQRRDCPAPVVEVPNNPLTKYPLLANISQTDAEHMYWYLNAYYAELNAQAEKEN